MWIRHTPVTTGSSGPSIGAWPVVMIMVLVVGLAVAPTRADETGEPGLGDGEMLSTLVLVADTSCPDPPAHLPAVDFRLELSDFESPVDPMTLEILASKEIRVELTTFRDGFEKGRSESYPLSTPGDREPADGSSDDPTVGRSLAIHDLSPGVVHYARALALVGDTWAPTRTIRFTTPICAVDGLDEEEVAP